MRSLSMSDVVVINRDGKSTAYYMDTADFKEVPKFLYINQRKRQQEKPEASQSAPPAPKKKKNEPER